MNGADDGGEVVDAPPSPSPPLEWKFSQVFGERAAGEEVQEGIVTDIDFYFFGSANSWAVCIATRFRFWIDSVMRVIGILPIELRNQLKDEQCVTGHGAYNGIPNLFALNAALNFAVAAKIPNLLTLNVAFNVAVDIISAIEFDKTGDHLATGDRGGRVVLFERTDTKDHGGSRRELERMDYQISRHPEFRYKTEFQSHEPEFDYLKSLEIEEKINKIRWCQTANGALFLLSTNDKTIKFWKVQEKKVKKISDMNMDASKAVGNGGVASSSISSSPRPYVANGANPDKSHNYMSNDFSFSPGSLSRYVYPCDGETFISADDLRINLWNLEISNQSFNIVDVKPANMEDLTEVITSAEFHPTHCNMLAYSSSKGSIRLIDLRQSALCDTHSKLFEEQEAPDIYALECRVLHLIWTFGSILACTVITGADDTQKVDKFFGTLSCSLCLDYWCHRGDMGTGMLWDINMDSGPVATFQVHEYLRPKLCDLYENDSIFDKFECCLSGDGQRVATGAESPGVDANGNSFDFTTKLLHLAWHPTENSIACAAANSLYMYYA
ncbi:protein phosphatase 2A, regulatory subunit PR55 [Actinidia rufa]|uniref:Serine/threonine-protein phosphatase 2A 55 kDa regulatory subunit B n=1 Tax=Actinidia rufa TaxID=165716 RepID=A0A7J0FZW3_9ERIC|nr:protein phosphatase 2A, regulatory subunit PR55 [Actinidia rufa]